MKRDTFNDLAAFITVAEHASFTKAAAQLGMSPSALSHAMKALETRLGVRLLARTTRSVSTTEAGELLLRELRPAFVGIDDALVRLGGLRDSPAGTIRITAPRHAASAVLWPLLPAFLDAHPQVRLEITVDDALTDIVGDRYDAGVRFGERIAGDMVALPIGPDVQPSVVASPAYLAKRPPPRAPKDLLGHRCLNYRFADSGGLYAWEFEQRGRPLPVRVDGPLVFNDSALLLAAALAGQGVAYLSRDQTAPYLARGQLVEMLGDWCPPWTGYFLYYPSRHKSPAFAALVAALQAQVLPARRTPSRAAPVARPTARARRTPAR